MVSRSVRWPQAYSVAQVALDHLVLLVSVPTCWDPRFMPQHKLLRLIIFYSLSHPTRGELTGSGFLKSCHQSVVRVSKDIHFSLKAHTNALQKKAG